MRFITIFKISFHISSNKFLMQKGFYGFLLLKFSMEFRTVVHIWLFREMLDFLLLFESIGFLFLERWVSSWIESTKRIKIQSWMSLFKRADSMFSIKYCWEYRCSPKDTDQKSSIQICFNRYISSGR